MKRVSARWVIRVGDAGSQLMNVIVLNGDPNESVSGRCYRRVIIDGSNNAGWRFGLWFVDKGFTAIGQTKHCQKAYLADILKARLLVKAADPWIGSRG